MKTEYTFDSSELESSLKECGKKGITELVVHDPEIAGNKSRLLHFFKVVEKDAPESLPRIRNVFRFSLTAWIKFCFLP